MEERLLEVKNLKVSFNVGKKKLTAVENVEFSLDKGKVIGIVGESGCGKSVTATSILRLVPPAVSIIDEDSQILFDGDDPHPQQTDLKKGCAGSVRGDAEAGGDPVSGAEDQGISPPAFGRDASAGHDRHGTALQPQAADRR